MNDEHEEQKLPCSECDRCKDYFFYCDVINICILHVYINPTGAESIFFLTAMSSIYVYYIYTYMTYVHIIYIKM